MAAATAGLLSGLALHTVDARDDGLAGHGPGGAVDAGFVDEFDAATLASDWTTMTGDGAVQLTFSQAAGAGRIEVDARADRRNIWWALIRHPVTPMIDLAELEKPGRELRVEARVRTDTAPRRINLHLNHSRTTNFHSHLREFDLPVAGQWQVVSMTTAGFDARDGDAVFVQLALMDWGRREYRLDVDYIKVHVVEPSGRGNDLGRPLPYRPEPVSREELAQELPAAAAATVDRTWPDSPGAWRPASGGGAERLVVSPSQSIILRWDTARLPTGHVSGWGVLELVTDAAWRSQPDVESFAELRVAEILGGPPDWDADVVTWEKLLDGQAAHEVINEQPVIDVAPAPVAGARTRIPLSPPVLERLLSGQSRGLAISSHGGIVAVFRGGATDMPVLYFNVTNRAAAGAATGGKQ